MRAQFRVTSSVHLLCIRDRDLRNLVPLPDYLRNVTEDNSTRFKGLNTIELGRRVWRGRYFSTSYVR